MKKLIISVISFGVMAFVAPSYAQESVKRTPETIDPSINVQVWSGRATAIDFSDVNEQITQIFLADPSRFTYATDTPLSNGQATTVFLRRIKPLNFPNLTTANVTNLFVKTKTSAGNSRLYTFNIQPGQNQPRYSTVNMAPIKANQINNLTVELGDGRKATLGDIERGLFASIRLGYAPPSDPVVSKVREFLALARNTSNKSLVEIAQNSNLSLRVLTELGLLGIEDSLKVRLNTLPNQPIDSLKVPVMENSTNR
jgi:hypothetical protein